MSFDRNGAIFGERPNQPQGWRRTPVAVLHHMIDWSVLRATWNKMVSMQLGEDLLRYLALINYGDQHGRQRTVQAIIDGAVHSMELVDRDDLEMRICWQRYNLFEGPTAEWRRTHCSDPARMVAHFRDFGATTFDFPIVAPPHGQRANTLWRAFRHLQAFIEAGARNQLQEALSLGEAVKHCNVIPAFEVNWFGVAKNRFWSMSRTQKQRYFEACMKLGWSHADGDRVYADLFGR